MIFNIFLGLIGIIAVILICGLFVKKEYKIEREITVDKPSQKVFEYMKYLKNQDFYSKWVMTDPNMKKEFRGNDGEVGFVYAWDGNKQAGKGEQEIKKLVNNELIETQVRFEKPFSGIAKTTFETIATGEKHTKVVWSMEGKNSYPLNLMHLLLKGILEKDMEQSLQQLKGILEEK